MPGHTHVLKTNAGDHTAHRSDREKANVGISPRLFDRKVVSVWIPAPTQEDTCRPTPMDTTFAYKG